MPAIAWMLVIFGASTEIGSSEHTSRFLIPILHWINPHISGVGVARAQLLVRKAAHVTEYAVLALLLLRAFRWQAQATFVRQAAIVLIVAAVYAATDEFHQSFAGTRTASLRDVMIDCCGAALGLAAYWLLASRRAPALAKSTHA